jgi:hypothetical protein
MIRKTFKVAKNPNVERYVTMPKISNFRGDGELLPWAATYRIIKRGSPYPSLSSTKSRQR